MVFAEVVLFLVGIFLLVQGAKYLVEGSSSLAKQLGFSTLIIGLTVVAFGTSMPELVVNIFAAIEGATEVAFGNVIGSNISNILLVLGIVAIITTVKTHYSTTWKEIPFSLLAVIVLLVMANKTAFEKDAVLSITRIDGVLMLLFFGIFVYYAFQLALRTRVRVEEEKLKIPRRNMIIIWLMIIGGMVGLFIGGGLVVDGAIYFAEQLGFSQFLISATVIAIGTSLPELVTSITAALKKDVDLAVGNIVGSNIFNIFWILGVTALIRPVSIPIFIDVDLIFLGIVTLLLFFFLVIGKKHQIGRKTGISFIVLYVMYIIFLVIRG